MTQFSVDYGYKAVSIDPHTMNFVSWTTNWAGAKIYSGAKWNYGLNGPLFVFDTYYNASSFYNFSPHTKLLRCAYVQCEAIHKKVLPIGNFNNKSTEEISRYWQSPAIPASSYLPPRGTTMALAVKFVTDLHRNTLELSSQLDFDLLDKLYNKYDIRSEALQSLAGPNT